MTVFELVNGNRLIVLGRGRFPDGELRQLKSSSVFLTIRLTATGGRTADEETKHLGSFLSNLPHFLAQLQSARLCQAVSKRLVVNYLRGRRRTRNVATRVAAGE